MRPRIRLKYYTARITNTLTADPTKKPVPITPPDEQSPEISNTPTPTYRMATYLWRSFQLRQVVSLKGADSISCQLVLLCLRVNCGGSSSLILSHLRWNFRMRSACCGQRLGGRLSCIRTTRSAPANGNSLFLRSRRSAVSPGRATVAVAMLEVCSAM